MLEEPYFFNSCDDVDCIVKWLCIFASKDDRYADLDGFGRVLFSILVASLLPVTVANMNYAGPIYLAVLVGAVSYWFLWAKKNWTGPNTKIVGIVMNDNASK